MPFWSSNDGGGADQFVIRSTNQKLQNLLVVSGGINYDDDMKRDTVLNNANVNVLEAMTADERRKYEGLSQYGKEEFKMALELQYLRRQLAQMETMEESNKAAQTSGRGMLRGSLPHSQQDISKLGVDIRKRIGKLGSSAQSLQKAAKAEGRIDEAKEVLKHMETTKGLYKKRFSVAKSYSGDGSEFGPIPGQDGRGEQNNLVTKEMDFNNIENSEIRESLRTDTEFQMFFQNVTEKDAIIDKYVDEISAATERLKNQAIGLQEELVVQKELLAETEEKVDSIDSKLKNTNRKLKETIKKVEEDKMCIYAVCFVLLLGLIGVILYETGVFGGKKDKGKKE